MLVVTLFTLTLSWVGFGEQYKTAHLSQGSGAVDSSTFEMALGCAQQLQMYS